MSEKKATRVGYGEALVELGAENEKIVVLDADLSCSTMTNGFAKAYPDRFFNAGIAEANMVTMAAGLSSMGYIPFCSTFAVFASRCYEQIRNGVCHPHLNVKFAFTHAGITVGEDGGTHQAIEDIAIMRALPGMTILAPCDAEEAKRAVRAAAAIDGPVYLRLSRPCYQLFALACVNKAPYHVYVAVNNVVLRVLMHAVHAFFREHYRYIRPCNARNIAMVVYGAAHFVLYHVQRLALRAHLLAGNGYSAHALRGAFYKPVKVALPRRADNHNVVRAVVRGKPHAAYVVLKAA